MDVLERLLDIGLVGLWQVCIDDAVAGPVAGRVSTCETAISSGNPEHAVSSAASTSSYHRRCMRKRSIMPLQQRQGETRIDSAVTSSSEPHVAVDKGQREVVRVLFEQVGHDRHRRPPLRAQNRYLSARGRQCSCVPDAGGEERSVERQRVGR